MALEVLREYGRSLGLTVEGIELVLRNGPKKDIGWVTWSTGRDGRPSPEVAKVPEGVFSVLHRVRMHGRRSPAEAGLSCWAAKEAFACRAPGGEVQGEGDGGPPKGQKEAVKPARAQLTSRVNHLARICSQPRGVTVEDRDQEAH